MDTDRNLLFGVLALQAGLIDPGQFVEACTLWATRKSVPLAGLLRERGWLLATDQDHLDYLLERRITQHGGNVHASLAVIPDDIKRSLAALQDDDIQRSLGGEPLAAEAQLATMDHVVAPSERYRRIRLHATGGIGRVWLAHDNNLSRDVALKELRPEQAGHATLGARFLQEARITGQLEHPGIIPVYELVPAQEGQRPFYTMRFVKGRTMSEAARAYHEQRLAGKTDALGLPALLNAFVTVCNTVAYAHARGVIHRDLKGQNVILGDFGEVVVLDWGLAKLVGRSEDDAQAASLVLDEAGADSGYTVQGQALGTPAYMAPEQSAGRLDLIDRRTDIYGLGAILYEILTGAAPFRADSTDELLRKVREEDPAPPRQLWPEVPPALEALCLKALAKQPADRPASATELALEVQGWQEFERRKAEDALRESEALYHSLVEHIPLGVFRKDLHGRFTFCNQRFCEQLGRPLEQLIGKDDYELFPARLADKYRRDDQQVVETGRTLDVEEEHPIPSSGQLKYVHVIKSPFHDRQGALVGTQGIFWDVTERKLAEEELRKSREALRESEALYHSLVETLPCVVVRKDLQLRYTFANHRFLELSGRSLDDLLGKTDFDINPRELAEKYQRDDRQAMESGGVFEDVEEVLFRGAKHYFHVLKTAVRDAQGKITGVQLIAWDVTARKHAEEELLRQTEILQSILHSMSDGVCVMDEKGEYLLWNRAAQEIVGLPLQEIAAVKSTEPCFYLPDKVTPYAPEQLALSRAMRGEVVDDIEVFVRHSKKPEGVFVSFNARPLKDALGFVCGGVSVFRDITARKRAEEELRRQTERFELAVAGSQDGLWDWDLTTDAVYYSPRYKAMLGYEDHEFPNRSEEWAKRVHPEDLERVRSETLAHFKSREPLSWVEFRMRHKDGSYRWIRSRAFVLRDSAGRVYRIAGSYEDITDRKTAEEELAQERYLLHTLMHNLPDGIYFKDTAGRFLRVNKAVMDTLHLDDPAQIVGKTDFDFFTKEYAQSTMTDEQEIIRTGRPLVGQEKLVGWLDGRQRWVSTTKMPFRDQGGNIIGTFGVTRDITERKQAEEILLRHEKRAP